MNRLYQFIPFILVGIFALSSCASGGGSAIVTGSIELGTPVLSKSIDQPSTEIWGFFSVSLNPMTREVNISPDRQAVFTMNIVKFLNNNPPSLAIDINKVVPGSGYIDVDFDVSITHPMGNAPQYNAYDVRGVFIGIAGANAFADMVAYGKYPHYPPCSTFIDNPGFPGSHEMLDDPSGDGGGPDGYTRWYSPYGFQNPGMFGYTKGLYASDIFTDPDYHHTADLNSYKYFADGLGAHDDLMDWLEAHPGSTRVFSSGATNTRNYYIRFPEKFMRFAYAVLADWEGPTIHPANMREAVACEKIYGTVHPDYHVYEFKIFDPKSGLNPSGWMEDYTINLFEVGDYWSGGTILTGEQLTPVQSGDGWNTYHWEIPTDIMQKTDGFDFWVVVSYSGYDYSNPPGIPNGMGIEPLAGWFCFDLDHSDTNWK
jgi:hypothetical protein